MSTARWDATAVAYQSMLMVIGRILMYSVSLNYKIMLLSSGSNVTISVVAHSGR